MAQIFISYAREDFQHAKALYQQLAGHGFSPWMDKVDLVGGQQWRPAIEQAIRSADFFLLLLSRNSVKKRGFVQRGLWISLVALFVFAVCLFVARRVEARNSAALP